MRQARGLSQLGRVQSAWVPTKTHTGSASWRGISSSSNDLVSLGDATEGLGRAAHHLNRLKVAVDHYRDALELFQGV